METTSQPLTIEVKPLSSPDIWPYDDLRKDFATQPDTLVLREVNADFYWEQLEIMPPMYCKRGVNYEGDTFKYIISGFGMCEFMSGDCTTVHFRVDTCPVCASKEEAKELFFSTIVNWGMHMDVIKALSDYIKASLSA